jgi:organic hydroperoxide reductase OsmC/OhrA
VRASVPNLDAAAFRKLAESTKDNCPISQVMKGNVPIELDAKLT